MSISTKEASHLPTAFLDDGHLRNGDLKILKYIWSGIKLKKHITNAFLRNINQSTDSMGVVRLERLNHRLHKTGRYVGELGVGFS